MAKKTPLHKKSWKKLSARQKVIRKKSLAVLSEARTSGKSVTKIARENNTSVKTIKNNTRSFRKVKGRLVPKKFDKVSRSMTINENGKAISIEINDSRIASDIGKYHNAVRQFLNTGDSNKLSDFKNKKIKDSSGNIHFFETNPDTIQRIEEKVEEIEFREIYAN